MVRTSQGTICVLVATAITVHVAWAACLKKLRQVTMLGNIQNNRASFSSLAATQLQCVTPFLLNLRTPVKGGSAYASSSPVL